MAEWIIEANDTEEAAEGKFAFIREVVRCKDCKWWKLSEYNTFGIYICKKFSGVRGEHDFCSRGERRTDEDNL